MDLGNRISILREKRGISQSRLADELHISQSTLAMYEKNKRTPNVEMLNKFADYFNVSIDYLVGRDDSKMTENHDLKKFVDENIQNGLFYGGGPATKEQEEQLKFALKTIFYKYNNNE